MKDRLIGFIKTYCLFVCILCCKTTVYAVLQIAVPGCLVCGLVQCHLAWVTFRPISGWLSDSYSRFLFITSVWTLSKSLHRIWCGYFLFISVLLSIILL